MAAENNIVGEVGLRVKPIDPGFDAGVQRIIDRLEKQSQINFKANGLEQIQAQANDTGRAFAQAAIEAAGFTAAVYGIKSAVTGAINKFSGLFDQLAQARAGFTSILKSEAAGGRLLDDIREFARVSPFVTQELVNYSQQLLGVGLAANKIIPLLKSTGDIISSVGGDTQNLGRVLFTLTQIKSIGSLKGQDTLQLQNSLIPITKYLSEYLHKSAAQIVKLREAGQISSEDVFNALNQQGEKVKGAMDRATRNIVGAKAILSDTITQMFQNQKVLNTIFNDIFQTIIRISNFISTPDFQDAFNSFFDGVNKIYEGLKPLFAELGKISGSGAITGLQVMGQAFNIIGGVLSAIPKAAMEAFARFIAALAVLKAPLLLIAYVSSIQRMGAAIVPAVSGLSRLGTQAVITAAEVGKETAATQANTAALIANARAQQAAGGGLSGLGGAGAGAGKAGFFSRNSGKISTGLAIGGVVAGGYLSARKDTASQTAGGALTGAGVGAQLGALAGPEGAVVGAVIGAGLGAITSFLGAEEKKAKAHIAAMKKIGEDAATAFIDAEASKFGAAASGDLFVGYKDKIAKLKADIDAINATGKTFSYRGTKGTSLTDQNRDKLLSAQTELEATNKASAATFEPITLGLRDLATGLDVGTQGYRALIAVHSGRGGKVFGDVKSIDEAEKSLAKYGISLADAANPDLREENIRRIKTFDGLTTAQQNATAAAEVFNKAFEEAAKASAAIFDPLEKKIEHQLSGLNAVSTAIKSNQAAGQDKSDVVKALTADNDALKVKEAVRTATGSEAKAEEAYAIIIKARGIAEQAANNAALAITKERIDQLVTLTGLVNNIDTRTIVINVTSTAVQKATEELIALQQARAGDLAAPSSVAPGGHGRREAGQHIGISDKELADAQHKLDILTGKTQAISVADRKLLADLTADAVKAANLAGQFWNPFIDMSNKYLKNLDTAKSLNDTFGSLFTVNADNVVALSGQLSDTQDVVKTIIQNANQVFTDTFKETLDPLVAATAQASSAWQQFEILQLTLGLTDAAFKSLLDSLGLVEPAGAGISGTFANVANTLGITNEQLAEAIGLMGAINPNLEIVVTADAQQAIDEFIRLTKSPGFDAATASTFGFSGDPGNQDRIDKGVTFVDPTKPTPSTKVDDTAKKAADAMASAAEAMANQVQAAADAIAAAAAAWVSSIKERTQYETAVSARRLTANADRQVKDLTELQSGLSNLRGRGVNQSVLDKLGINNVADTRQVRKLVNASDAELAAVVASVNKLDTKASELALTEEESRTRKNIANAIIDAAKTLGLDKPTSDAAAGLAAQFVIQPGVNAEQVAQQILEALTSGRLG